MKENMFIQKTVMKTLINKLNKLNRKKQIKQIDRIIKNLLTSFKYIFFLKDL